MSTRRGQPSKRTKTPQRKTVYTALKAIDSLKVMFAPFLPFTCEKLHGFFNYETPLFGEQYTETVKDSLGEHTVLRYRTGRVEGCRNGNPASYSLGRS